MVKNKNSTENKTVDWWRGVFVLRYGVIKRIMEKSDKK
jgi:hypothetical protein